ncbi:MAG: HEAT repeat domain-containing protein [Thermoanaerobaculia bacterium]
MRTYAPLLLLALVACTAAPPPAPAPEPVQAGPHGITAMEEAQILRLEDRREYDAAVARSWAQHPNALHRERIAIALGRIGAIAFSDTNGDGLRDDDERMAGVDVLTSLASDPEFTVRRAVAFSLGEIGDTSSIDTLLTLARDAQHSDVAAEAVEALSKMAAQVDLARYAELTGSKAPAGVRARAIRFLFRFGKDEASAIAAASLGDDDPNIRREAAYALSRRAYSAAGTTLALTLTDADTLTRSHAARALGLFGTADQIEPLLTATSDMHPWVRINAARSLAQIFDRSPEAILRGQVHENASAAITLSDDPDPGTRATAIDLLGWYARHDSNAKKRLLELAVNGGAWQRELAAGAIAKHFGDDPGTPIDALLQTDAVWVKVRIAEASAGLEKRGAELRRRLATDASETVRAAAIGAIPDAKILEEIELVERAIEDPDVVVRGTAIDRFALQARDDAARKFEVLSAAERRALSDPTNDARVSAVAAIGKLDTPEREPFLRLRLADRDPIVRRMAAELLAEHVTKKRVQYTPLPVNRPIEEYVAVAEWAASPHTATIRTARGAIDIMLLPQSAPMTVKNFADLAARGYFNGTSFMRVVPNFVIQGGDPRNDMSGGPGYAIRDEINLQKYTRGAVGMALSGPDTGGSQFFVTHSPQPHLDGGYTIFGRVVHGMSGVVDQIERGTRVETIAIDGVTHASAEEIVAVERPPLPVVTGEMTSQRLLDLPEWRKNFGEYAPDEAIVETIASVVRPGDRVEVFLGTWCSDSQREIPRLLKMSELLRARGVELPLRFVAIDRSKKEPATLLGGQVIELVPTIIYYRGDAEIGRIVESSEGTFEDHFMRIAGQ